MADEWLDVYAWLVQNGYVAAAEALLAQAATPSPSAPPLPPSPPETGPSPTPWWVIAVPIIDVVVVAAALFAWYWFYWRKRGGLRAWGACFRRALCFCCPGSRSPSDVELEESISGSKAGDAAGARDSNLTRRHDRQRLIEQLGGGGVPSDSHDPDSSDDDAETAHSADRWAADAVASAGSPDAALLSALSAGTSARRVRALLGRGARAEAAFLDTTALALAARTCAPGVARALLAAGAVLDKKDARGWTALMHAIEAHGPACPREAVLMALLDAGAAVEVWGDDLKGPFELIEAKAVEVSGGDEGLRRISQRLSPSRGHRVDSPSCSPSCRSCEESSGAGPSGAVGEPAEHPNGAGGANRV